MRALLVVNPGATATTARSRDVLANALRNEIDLEIGYTRERGHAAKLAQEAAADNVDVVVILGGDGTVNEVVNGLLADHPPVPAPGSGPGALAGNGQAVPAVAVVPGGATNVFARAVGLPRDWAESAGVILEALREKPVRTRTIGLGMAEDRYFTFCAGMGIDADVIKRVDNARNRGRTAGAPLYLASTAVELFATTNRHRPQARLAWPDADPVEQVTAAIVQNTAPWTYLGARPVQVCPHASFDADLDLMAVRGLHLPSAGRTIWQMLRGPGLPGWRTGPHGRRVLQLHDVTSFTLTTPAPMPLQMDGEYLGTRQAVSFRSVRAGLRVIC